MTLESKSTWSRPGSEYAEMSGGLNSVESASTAAAWLAIS